MATTDKRDYWRAIEAKIQAQWKAENQFERTVNLDQPKHFVTFPYPYMNGKLHLGHGYTASRVDYRAKYKSMQGYNVLFPFGFHVTGTPIYASAHQLKIELEQDLPQKPKKAILLAMDVPEEEIPKFVDPHYWTSYFPPLGKKALDQLGFSIDWRRSFITTALNPYYDQFVKWQFHHLIKQGIIAKGRRPAIYCPKDGQICNDHDRLVGEGVKVAKRTYHRVNVGELDGRPVYVLFDTETKKMAKDTQLYCDPGVCYQMMTFEQSSGLNYQTGSKFEITESHPEFKPNFSALTIDYNSHPDRPFIWECVTIHEPESLVISRSGDRCCVAFLDQYYIAYGQDKDREFLKKYVESQVFNLYSKETKKSLCEAIDWLRDWPCTRQTGLGTVFPIDETQIIDSLSDSTIYMAYYTIAHYLENSKIDAVKMTVDVYDYIFNITNEKPKSNHIDAEWGQMLEKMREEFMYWYPLDLRVSGKDLIGNHLTMCLYNHYFIWWDEKYLPRNLVCNGYININGEKMCKSNGNFITIDAVMDPNKQVIIKSKDDDIVIQATADSLRLALATAGDGHDDANFESSVTNNNILILKREEEWIHGIIKTNFIDSAPANRGLFVDCVFESRINQIIEDCTQAYEQMIYRDVVKLGFHGMITAKNKYFDYLDRNGIEPNPHLVQRYISVFCQLMAPIIPHFSEWVWTGLLNHKTSIFRSGFPTSSKSDRCYLAMVDFLDATLSNLKDTINVATKKKPGAYKTAKVNYVTTWPEWFLEAKSLYEQCGKDTKIMMKQIGTHPQLKSQMKHIIKNIENFGPPPQFDIQIIFKEFKDHQSYYIPGYEVEFVKVENPHIIPYQTVIRLE
jgi:leucyl-tRNA synthetase